MAITKAIISPGTREIILPENEALGNLIPENRSIEYRGERCIVLPHTTDVTRLARNMGFVVPAPILSQYDWPTNPIPFDTQKTTAALLTMNPRAYVLSEMGTGKTRGALFACDHMFQENQIKKVLVTAPLSTLSQVWDAEIFEHFMHLETAVVYGSTRAKRIKELKKHAQIYIINHDGCLVLSDELLKMQFDAIIIDEIGTYRNKNTDRWKAMDVLAKRAKYAWGMTGSPTPTEPPDAWGLAKMLTPQRAPDHKKAFIRKTMTQVSQFRWIPKSDANDHVYAMLQPAVRFTRDDCGELPETSYKTIEVPQSKQIKDVYDNLIKKLRIAFAEGEVTAANEGVLFMKLLQIASGWVYTKNKGVVALDNKKRVAELVDIYNESAGKVICFTNFKHSTEELYLRVMKKIPCSVVHGGTPKKYRDEIFSTFQNSSEKSMIIAHPQCMAHGLTLTEANTIVWFTPTTSLEIYEQANARITRFGQVRKSLIVHLTGSPIESRIYSRLRQKAKIQGALLDMFNDN